MRILTFISFILLTSTYSVFGQVRSEYNRSLYVDVDGTLGLMNESIKTIPFSTNHLDAINNSYQGKLKFTKGFSTGCNVNVGYYVDKKRTFGIASGINYYSQYGKLGMDSFHVEFKSTNPNDPNGGAFRQVISTNHSIAESIQLQTLSIPVLLIYKRAINKDLFLTASAGIVYNLSAKTTYNTNASFDYEAIYQFKGTDNPVYDNSVIPGSEDLLITKAWYEAYLAKHPNSPSLNDFFQSSNDSGAAKGSVGLNEQANKKTGSVKYQSGSLGYTAQVAANYRVMKNVYVTGGVYYTAQSFKNTSNNNSLTLTSSKVQGKNGQDLGVNYNSLLNEVQTLKGNNYGITIGVRVYLNKSAWKNQDPDDMQRVTPEGPKAK